MKPSKILFFMALMAISIVACKPRQAPPQAEEATGQPATIEETVSEDAQPKCLPLTKGTKLPESDMMDGFTTNMNGNCLEFKLTYTGGCATHEFNLYWDGSWMKSYPPQVNVTLTHDNKGDACKSIVNQVVAFDLSPIKSEGVGQVIVNINAEGNALQRANYTY